jgi:REP element-mobilizing transposase RayT
VIGAYKSLTACAYIEGVNVGAWPPFRHRLWQRNYYEHILRHDESLAELRQYILYNPARWAFDPRESAGASLIFTRPCSWEGGFQP